jgi:pimeloyl-ACP methyl ester carboxylesterase
MPVEPAELREAGRRAAELAWQAVDETPIELEDPLRPEFAAAALDRLEQLQREAPGVMRRILEGSDRGAEGLNADPLAEVIQNADDAAAREVRMAVVESPRPTLLMAHAGGERVRIDHVLPMSFAFLSTKRSSAEATGKFGVGLQTLKTLPIHVVWGSKDRIARARTSRHADELPEHATVATWADCGHMVMWDAPQRVVSEALTLSASDDVSADPLIDKGAPTHRLDGRIRS